MITRQLTFVVATDSGHVSVGRGEHHPDAVSLKQGGDHILMDNVETAKDLRDALSELIAEMDASK